jgi:hypothetical protein
MLYWCTKHFNVQQQFIRQVLEDGLVTLTKIKAQDNPSDVQVLAKLNTNIACS